MNEFVATMIAALWAGILTSISPCPLATNIAAISFIAKRVDSVTKVTLGGLLYTLGRALTYAVLVGLLVSAITAAPDLSHLLQKYMNKIVGPILIIVGLILLEIIPVQFNFSSGEKNLQKQAEKWGIWAAFPLGVLFALSLCPTSAALFFGTMLPLAIKFDSIFIIPMFYGLGTALPVIGFALLIAMGTNSISRIFNKVTVFEKWARRTTGVIFIGVGAHLSLGYWFGIELL